MFGFPWESIGEIFTKFSFPPPPSLSLRSRWSQRKDAWQAVSEELRREANSKTGSSLLGRPGSLTRTAQLPRARPPAAAAARAPVCKRKSESLPYLGVALESRRAFSRSAPIKGTLPAGSPFRSVTSLTPPPFPASRAFFYGGAREPPSPPALSNTNTASVSSWPLQVALASRSAALLLSPPWPPSLY